jgi:hypothetical protein
MSVPSGPATTGPSTPAPLTIGVDPITVSNIGIIAAHLARDARPWYARPSTWLAGFPAVLLAIGLIVSATVTSTAVRAPAAPPSVTVTTPPVTVLPAPVAAPIVPAVPAVPEAPSPALPGRSDATLSGIYGAGTYVVGRDIAPGGYWTRGPDYGDLATWQRLADTSGEAAPLALGVVEGPTQITILSTDKAVKFTGGATWTAAS